jgi:non-heme chloroperoxidase
MVPAHTVIGGGGVRIHVEEAGNPQRPPVLFIHGFSQSLLSWFRQLESQPLSGQLRLFAMDIRGHGRSDKPLDPNAYDDSAQWAADVNNVITGLGLNQPVLCGWSYGGAIICDYLRAHGDDQIGGINLVGALSKLGSAEAFALLSNDFLALVPGFKSADVTESVGALQALLKLVTREELLLKDLFLFLGFNTIVPPPVRAALLNRVFDNDDVLSQISKPVLITHGQQDAIVLLAAAQQHAALIPHARTSFYANVGHAPFLEDTQRFNQELRQFVQSI